MRNKINSNYQEIEKSILVFSIFFFSVSFFSVKFFAIGFFSLLLLFYFDYAKRGLFYFDRALSLFMGGLLLIVFCFSVFNEIYLNYLIKVFLIFIYFHMLGSFLIRSNSLSLLKGVITWVLVIHMAAFYLQFIISNVFGFYIDFDSYIRDQDSASLHLTRSLDGLWISSRGGGVFSEPSFYSMLVLPLSSFLIYLNRRFDVVSSLGFFSIFLSLSMAGITIAIFAFLVVVAYGMVPRKYLFPIVFFSIVMFPIVYQVYELRIVESVDYNAIEYRSAIFDELARRDFFTTLFGAGFLWDETQLQGMLRLEGAEIRDASFLVYLTYGGGWLGVAIFTTFILFTFKSKRFLLLFLPFFLFKYHFVTSILWFVIFFGYFTYKASLNEDTSYS